MGYRIGSTAILDFMADAGDTTKHPQSVVYDIAGAAIATVPHTHRADGYYSSAWALIAPPPLKVVTTLYDDENHLIPSTVYERQMTELGPSDSMPRGGDMGRLITFEASVPANSQFAGGEFGSIDAVHGAVFDKLLVQFGSESKTWRVRVRTKGGAVVVVREGTTTATSLVLTPNDVDFTLESGDELELITADATSAMKAKLYLREIAVRT